MKVFFASAIAFSHASQPSPFKHCAQRPSQLQSFLKVPLSYPSHSRFFPTKTSSSCRSLDEEGRPDEDYALNTKPLASTSRDALAVCGRKTKKNSGVSNGIGTPSQGKYLSRDTVPVGRLQNDTSCIPRRRAAACSGRSPTHQNAHTNPQNPDSQVPQAG